MNWKSYIYTSSSLHTNLESLQTDLMADFGPKGCDLGFLFVSIQYRQQLVDSWSALRKEIPARVVIGCTASGIIGRIREIEEEPAVSFIGASLPGVNVQPFHLHQENMPSLDDSPKKWRDLFKISKGEDPQFILLSDPFSIDAQTLIDGLDFAFPKSPKVGGIASGSNVPNGNLLLDEDKAYHKGVIGVALSGNIAMNPIVAQGCRPIGEPLTITHADNNILVTVNNESPIKYIGHLYDKLEPRDQELLRSSLFVGLLMDSFIEKPKQGDFLIRTIVGADQEQGLLAIGSPLRVGQTLQFHVRDADTSRTDLKTVLSNYLAKTSPQAGGKALSKTGGLIFSCMGRGSNLYGVPNHDAKMVDSVIGHLPLAGFFCSGEIGPVGGKTYLHGYTSSMAIFTEKPPKEKSPEALLESLTNS